MTEEEAVKMGLVYEKTTGMICPLRTAAGGKCVGNRCAMWYQKINNSGENVSKCGFLMAANALVHLAEVGMDVYH
jgi:hypothetical protein